MVNAEKNVSKDKKLTLNKAFKILNDALSDFQPLDKKDESAKRLNQNLMFLNANLLDRYNNTHNKLEINSKWLKDFINPPQKAIAISNKLVSSLHKESTIGYTTKKKLTVQKHLIEKFQKETKT